MRPSDHPFTPSAGFGNVPLYGRYRFVKREKLDFAGDLIFVLPADTAFALEVALPFRIKPNDRLSVFLRTYPAGPTSPNRVWSWLVSSRR